MCIRDSTYAFIIIVKGIDTTKGTIKAAEEATIINRLTAKHTNTKVVSLDTSIQDFFTAFHGDTPSSIEWKVAYAVKIDRVNDTEITPTEHAMTA